MSVRKIYTKAVMNGFVIEIDDHNYNESVYVSKDWDEAVAIMKDNMPTVKTEVADSPIPATVV